MNPLNSILQAQPFMLLDGALATELEARGADLHDPLWSAKVLLEQPELIRAVHLDYFYAGAQCAITASYQASIAGFMRRGLNEHEALQLIKRSVTLAQEAREIFLADTRHTHPPIRPLIAGSVGPYGAYLADGSEYRGNYGLSQAELIDFHRPRMRALVEAGVDLLACETIPCLEEAIALVELLREFPHTTAWISFSARDGLHTSQGERLSACARLLDTCDQIVAIGINCTSPRYINSLIAEIRSSSDKPIVVYPNSGEEYDASSGSWSGQRNEESFSQQAATWYTAGARLIGGCCRTTPTDIRQLAAQLQTS